MIFIILISNIIILLLDIYKFLGGESPFLGTKRDKKEALIQLEKMAIIHDAQIKDIFIKQQQIEEKLKDIEPKDNLKPMKLIEEVNLDWLKKYE